MSLDLDLVIDACPRCGRGAEAVYSINITHNLTKIAKEAGVYYDIWRPEEVGVKEARNLIIPLKEAIKKLKADPDYFKRFEPENKWGTAEIFIKQLGELLEACQTWPRARIETDR